MESPGKTGPAVFALMSSKPQLGSFTTLMRQKQNPRSLFGGCLPFSNGASSVASALSIRSGATPRGHCQPNTPLPKFRSKQDISTLLAIGHFYFALTGILP